MEPQTAGTQELIDQHLKILRSLQYESGLFAASKKGIGTGYDKAWLRDNFYETLAFEAVGDLETLRTTYRALLSIFKKHESKIDHAIAQKPVYTHQYIHARFHPTTFEEYWEEWGNKQNDAIGCLLFKIGEVEAMKPGYLLESEDDKRIVQKLVRYLATLQYWNDPDSGMWEENQELHASSVGACLAGLAKIKGLPGMDVPQELLDRGAESLRKLLPRESGSKFADLALLSLIWPYKVLTEEETVKVLANVEYHLLRDRGVIRYKNDRYYNKNADGYSEEAEWTFGLSWLAIIYKERGDEAKAREYIAQAKSALCELGVPELYYSNSRTFNDNTPLGWSESMFIVALNRVEKGIVS